MRQALTPTCPSTKRRKNRYRPPVALLGIFAPTLIRKCRWDCRLDCKTCSVVTLLRPHRSLSESLGITFFVESLSIHKHCMAWLLGNSVSGKTILAKVLPLPRV